MEKFLQKLGTSFTQLWNRQEKLYLKSIRISRIHYTLGYAFELAFYNIGDFYIFENRPLFGMAASTLLYIGHAAFSLIVMLLWSDRFKYLIRISTVVTLIGIIPFLFLPGGLLRTVFAIIAWTGLGGCVTAGRCGYAFAANNAERLFGVLFSFLVTILYIFLRSSGTQNIIFTHVLPIALLTGMVIALNLFQEGSLEVKADSKPSDSRAVFIAMAYMIVYYAIDGYAWRLVEGSNSSFMWMGIGALLATIIFIVVHALFKKSIWHIWNIYFAIAIIMALLAMFSSSYNLFVPSQLFIGLSLIGYPASLYMLGCVQRRFASYKLLKQCTVMFVVLLPITTLSDDIIGDLYPQAIPAVALVLTVTIFIGFTLAAPTSYKYLFSTGWMEDFRKSDMAKKQEQAGADCFDDYGLTPREKEVGALLLSANTVRMIAGELKISQSTVNMHSANLYRKLEINSKAELFKKFGVTEKLD